MNEKGAKRWSQLMRDTLAASSTVMTDDPRIRTSINTFLTHFMAKYAGEFSFENRSVFGETNPPIKTRVNFMKMTTAAIEALSQSDLSEALADRGVDVSKYPDKDALVRKALMG
jgi:hypothetical protein